MIRVEGGVQHLTYTCLGGIERSSTESSLSGLSSPCGAIVACTLVRSSIKSGYLMLKVQGCLATNVNADEFELMGGDANSCQRGASVRSAACHISLPSWWFVADSGCFHTLDPLTLLASWWCLSHPAAAAAVHGCGCVCVSHGVPGPCYGFLLLKVALKALDSAPPAQNFQN